MTLAAVSHQGAQFRDIWPIPAWTCRSYRPTTSLAALVVADTLPLTVSLLQPTADATAMAR